MQSGTVLANVALLQDAAAAVFVSADVGADDTAAGGYAMVMGMGDDGAYGDAYGGVAAATSGGDDGSSDDDGDDTSRSDRWESSQREKRTSRLAPKLSSERRTAEVGKSPQMTWAGKQG